ncbi:MAG: hypothetical protein ABWY95_02065, partial [Thermoleophilaceae bacterium]
PLAAFAIALPGVAGTAAETFEYAFAGWTLLLAAAVVLLAGALAARSGGDRRLALFATAAMPFLLGAMVRTHFDLAPMALLLGALLLLCAGRPRLGLAVLGLAVMTKGFPLVAAPVAIAWLVGRGDRKAAIDGGLLLAGVVLVLALLSVAVSPLGAKDAFEYQTQRPIQIESTPAVVLRTLDGLGLGETTKDTSHRSDGLLHPADGAVGTVAMVALLAAIAGFTLMAAAAGRSAAGSAPLHERSHGGESAPPGEDPSPGEDVPPGEARVLVLAALAAVLAFAVLGKVLSPQYLIWIVPLGALALSWRRYALAATILAACVLTQIEFPTRYLELVDGDAFAVAVVVARDLTLLAALALCARDLRALRTPARAAARSA